MSAHVVDFIERACECFPSQGRPYAMTATQIAIYSDALAQYQPEALLAALKAHMRESKWFPALSELLEHLEPQTDTKALAELAWLSVQTAIRRGGVYRGATFQTGAVGEAVRQVFGTWSMACSFAVDSPGWTVKRQQFLAIFPTLLKRFSGESVTLTGLHEGSAPYAVPTLAGAPTRGELGAGRPIVPATRQEAIEALSRAGMLQGVK